MKAQLRKTADQLRASYWFLPSLMALGAMVLSSAMVSLDTYVGSEWMDQVSWLRAARPEGARQVLSAIGGSMITVAGTVFSVTIAAVVYASGQYGPRLLTNFMGDRGNQVTLGTFISTYLYCLLVMRTVRSAEEARAETGMHAANGFVPNLALLVGVVLALCSIAVLIFFIHHVPSRIHINSVIEHIGHQLLADIPTRFPKFLGEAARSAPPHGQDPRVPLPLRPDAPESEAAQVRPIAASATGYVQVLDDTTLLQVAVRSELVLHLRYQPGDYVHAGRVLLEAWPAARLTEQDVRELRACFGLGSRRTALQDLGFLLDELVEIASRAMSPGTNDPFTAITCLDWLGAVVGELASRELPDPLRTDEQGALRVITHPIRFGGFLERSFGTLRQYVAGDGLVCLHFLRALAEVATVCEDPARLELLRREVDRLVELARTRLSGASLQQVSARADKVRGALSTPEARRRLREHMTWTEDAD